MEVASGRECGACSLCCTLLRVDELAKRGGVDCVHQRPEGGCGIYERRPGICRAYRCLWLRGHFEESDRPDRLGAVLDFVNHGGTLMLEVREAREGSFDASPRLQEIAERQRATLPVRVTDADDVMDPDRPFRVLLPGGEEQRVAGDRIEVHRPGQPVEVRRLPLLERLARRALLRLRARRLRGSRDGPQVAKR
ncbi:MAG: YkgJ family cysteine cluster protein [Myxococcota bacterium]